jgi:hypothetical protein
LDFLEHRGAVRRQGEGVFGVRGVGFWGRWVRFDFALGGVGLCR